jgi:hypothetical protein
VLLIFWKCVSYGCWIRTAYSSFFFSHLRIRPCGLLQLEVVSETINFIQIFGRNIWTEIGRSQGIYTCKGQRKKRGSNIHAPSSIGTHDPSVRHVETVPADDRMAAVIGSHGSISLLNFNNNYATHVLLSLLNPPDIYSQVPRNSFKDSL